MSRRKHNARGFIYWLHTWFSLNLARELLGVVARCVVSRFLGSRHYHSIRLIAYPPYRIDALTEVVEALELVRQMDARRFRRIKQSIKQIVLANWSVKDVGVYKPLNHVCLLTKLPVPENARFLAAYAYASVLVHEATHGVLDQQRFPYLKANRRRIENLCKKEEERFMVKVARSNTGKWKAYCTYTAALVGKDVRRPKEGNR